MRIWKNLILLGLKCSYIYGVQELWWKIVKQFYDSPVWIGFWGDRRKRQMIWEIFGNVDIVDRIVDCLIMFGFVQENLVWIRVFTIGGASFGFLVGFEDRVSENPVSIQINQLWQDLKKSRFLPVQSTPYYDNFNIPKIHILCSLVTIY